MTSTTSRVSSLIIPLDYDWHLLAGDETAPPAIGRQLEELPVGARAIAILRVADVDDRRALPSAARVEAPRVGDDRALVDVVRKFTLPPGAGYAARARSARWPRCAASSSTRRGMTDMRLAPRPTGSAARWRTTRTSMGDTNR